MSAASSDGSSTSSTPLPLTPESTGADGSEGSSPSSQQQQKKKPVRRQTAVYNPLASAASSLSPKPLKPFSRSAAKRESVLALGSIEHLQHYFSQTGIVRKKNPLLKKYKSQGLVPAIGGSLSPTSPGGDHTRNSSLDSLLKHPPLPPPPREQAAGPQLPHVKTHQVHPDSLLPGVIYDLTELVKAWRIDAAASPAAPSTMDVMGLLKTTIRSIHSVRNYILSLPDEATLAIRARFTTTGDPLPLIRRSALEVLARARDLEERARLPLSDDAYDAQSDGGGGGGGGGASSGSRVASPDPLAGPEDDSAAMLQDPTITFSLVQVNGKVESVPRWVDEDDFDPFEDLEERPRERWEARLELANGWLYRRDMTPADLTAERDVVEDYVDLVDDVLFGDVGSGKTGSGAERNFELVRRKLEVRASRMAEAVGGSSSSLGRRSGKHRRISAADALEPAPPSASALFIDTSGGRRRVSTGLLMGRIVTEEPESSLHGLKEEEGSMTGEETEYEDEDLPEWAQRNAFVGDEIGRAYTFLKYFLPQSYLFAMIPPSDEFEEPPPSPSPYAQESPVPPPSRTNFYASLSSGQILCYAYNNCVRRSRHQWGFVSRDAVHDVLGLEARERERAAGGRPVTPTKNPGAGWTFRRTDNLRLWAGAIKLRYLLPIHMRSHVIAAMPSLLQLPAANLNGPVPMARGYSAGQQQTTPRSQAVTLPSVTPLSTTPTSPSFSTQFGILKEKEKIPFDASVVARQDEGWEDLIEGVLFKWMWSAVEERRRVDNN